MSDIATSFILSTSILNDFAKFLDETKEKYEINDAFGLLFRAIAIDYVHDNKSLPEFAGNISNMIISTPYIVDKINDKEDLESERIQEISNLISEKPENLVHLPLSLLSEKSYQIFKQIVTSKTETP